MVPLEIIQQVTTESELVHRGAWIYTLEPDAGLVSIVIANLDAGNRVNDGNTVAHVVVVEGLDDIVRFTRAADLRRKLAAIRRDHPGENQELAQQPQHQ